MSIVCCACFDKRSKVFNLLATAGEFSLETQFEMLIVPICFSLKKNIFSFSLCSWATEIPAIIAALTFTAYIYFSINQFSVSSETF